ncbi:MAG: hypothetical protein BHW64_04320 [Candidatus Melainabacteria bacterium LEY3_CP_29_8]|nr:MAG: hypothetical protein BHW64_04320 [Candidatus Melainabacteria bacterium LEY3_CP_29_8]
MIKVRQTLSERLHISVWLVAFSIMLPTLFSMLATSTVNVAIAHIGGAFGATRDEVNWVVTSYMIAHGIMLPVTGYLENRFGRRNFLKAISVIFGLGSFLCIIASSLNMLILGRIIQGIGGGPFMPLSQAILLQTFKKEQHGIAMAIFSLGIMVSAIVGPSIGGFLVDNLSWRWIFIINIPVAIMSVILIHINILNSNISIKPGKFDKPGFISLVIWLLSMQIVLDKGQQYGWFDCRWICCLSFVACCAMVFFIVRELESKTAFTDIRIFKNFNFVIGTILGSFVNMIAYMTLVVIPVYVQTLMGYTASLSGYSLLPRALSCIVSMFVVAKLVTIIDNRILIALGFMILGVSTFMFTNLNLSWGFSSLILPNILLGIGIIMTFIPIASLALSTLPKEKLALGAGLHSLCKCVVTAFTISISNAMITMFSQAHQNYLIKNLTGTNLVFQNKINILISKLSHFNIGYIALKKANVIIYNQLLTQSKLMAFTDIFAIFALMAIILTPLAFSLKITKKI